MALAASMDARGYGRTAAVPARVRTLTNVLTLGGLLGICAGAYGLVAVEGAGYGLPLVAAGLAAAVAGLRLGGRRSVRTRYRPDRCRARLAGRGVGGRRRGAGGLGGDRPGGGGAASGVAPLVAPELPVWPALSVLVGLVPARFVAPRAGEVKEPVR